MDLRLYYQKLKKAEEEMADQHVVMVSMETTDGGRPGVKTEVARAIAAKMLVEGRARLANKEEAAQHYKVMADARRATEQVQLATRLQVNVISESDLKALRGGSRPEKQ